MQLNVSKITIQRLLAQLGIRKLCSRFVPKFLTAEMMVRRFNACKHNISLMDEIRPRFLENIVTEDEPPLSLYIPFSKRESKEWVLPGYSTTWRNTYEIGRSIQENLKSEVNTFFSERTIHSSKLDSKPWWIAGESVWLSIEITLKNHTYIHCLFQIQNLFDLPFYFYASLITYEAHILYFL